MKKVLSLLASCALISSTTLTVVACGEPKTNEHQPQDPNFNVRNNLNNLLGAAASEAKAIILDNEFGFSQEFVTKPILNNLQASEVITGFDPTADPGLNGQSKVGDVVNRYLVKETNNYQHLQSQNIELGHKKGHESWIQSLIPEEGLFGINKAFLVDIINGVLESLLEEDSELLSGQNTIAVFNQIFDDNITDDLVNLLIQLLSGFNIKDITTHPQIKKIIAVVSEFFKAFLSENKVFDTVRDLNNTLFNQNSDEYLIKTLYESNSETITPIEKISTSRVKAEIMLSVVRILKLVYVIPAETDEAFVNIKEGSDDEISLVFANFLSNLLSQKSWEMQDINKNLHPLVQEIFRIVTIFNAYFSFFDQTKTFQPTNDQHLFSNDVDNYQFLSQTVLDKSLGDSQYVKDKAININYFVANLDYYFGSLTQQNDQSAYRIQQGMFLLLNDPARNYQPNPSYEDKPSFLTDMLLKTFLMAGIKSAPGEQRDLLLNYLNDKSEFKTINDIFLKPFLLGLVDGQDISSSLRALESIVKNLDQFVPNLMFFKDYLDDISTVLSRVRKKYEPMFIHPLLTDDLRPMFNNLKVVNDDLLNRWFNPDQKVNVQTLFAQPLNKMLFLFNPGSTNDNYSTFGEEFLNNSIPQLVRLFGDYFNKMNKNFDSQTAAYDNNQDVTTSLKTLNINLNLLNGLINDILGDSMGEGNILSTIVESLFSYTDAEKDNSLVVSLGLYPKKVLENLGMTEKSTFKEDSFFGRLMQFFLPLAKPENGQVVLNDESFKVDYLGQWLHNLVHIIKTLNTSTDYTKFIKQLLANEKTFTIKLRQEEVKYFYNQEGQIESFAFLVEFIHPVTLKQTNYIVRLRRDGLGQTFKIYELTSDKMKGAN